MNQNQYEAAREAMTDHLEMIKDVLMPELESIMKNTVSDAVAAHWNKLNDMMNEIERSVIMIDDEYANKLIQQDGMYAISF